MFSGLCAPPRECRIACVLRYGRAREVVSELFWKPKQAEEWGRRPVKIYVLVTFSVNSGLREIYVAFMSLVVLSLGSLGSPGGGLFGSVSGVFATRLAVWILPLLFSSFRG